MTKKTKKAQPAKAKRVTKDELSKLRTAAGKQTYKYAEHKGETRMAVLKACTKPAHITDIADRVYGKGKLKAPFRAARVAVAAAVAVLMLQRVKPAVYVVTQKGKTAIGAGLTTFHTGRGKKVGAKPAQKPAPKPQQARPAKKAAPKAAKPAPKVKAKPAAKAAPKPKAPAKANGVDSAQLNAVLRYAVLPPKPAPVSTTPVA